MARKSIRSHGKKPSKRLDQVVDDTKGIANLFFFFLTDTSKDIKMIIRHLLEMLTHKNVSGHGRDQALNLLIRNVPRKDLGIRDNTKSLDAIDFGLKKILKVGGQFPELPNCLPLTENTCLTASILLNKLYDDLRCDEERATFRKICEEYITWTLLPLALHGTDVGKIKASHALAKIAAISDPEIAFPGERIYEVVRPLVSLLNTERDGIQNYEALMSLTNISAKSEKLRQKIIKEKALPEIECYMFEEHDQIRQAATECMCNMVVCKEVQERFVAEGNDRMKLLVLLCGEDDVKVQLAAAGAVAMLTASQKELCHKLTRVTVQWLEILQRLCMHDNVEIQHRGLVIVFNLMEADKEIAKKLIESEMLEILTVISKLENNVKHQDAINMARECLTKAMDYSLIKPTS
ncbi:protein unc-45 homolog B-like [Rhincodon typus]|uniref:protein unc-45 homolog B-like n=1 Tax=Rhincodon typus TaxID=259920 RepID=UPI00202F984D|nr:protein unc-45 homolog B-like [Rhincodon typus]